MVDGHRAATAGTLLALALTTSACGDPDNRPSEARSSAVASSPVATPSTTPTPGATASSVARGVLYLVPSDGAGACDVTGHPLGVACDATGTTAYRFQPQAVRRVQVTDVAAIEADGGQWAVQLAFDSAGRRTLTRVTRAAARAREYVLVMTNRRGGVVSAPQVQQPITGGQVQISGLADRLAAQRIVNQITSTAR